MLRLERLCPGRLQDMYLGLCRREETGKGERSKIKIVEMYWQAALTGHESADNFVTPKRR